MGCLICCYSVEDRENINKIATKFQESINEIDNYIQGVVHKMENLFNMLAEMNQMTLDVEEDVNGAANVVNKISSNASRSNMLALNASIEAGCENITHFRY